MLSLLEQIARDTDAPAASRAAAARAVLEVQGMLGRHQVAPGEAAASRPLSEASRSELEAELARLRLHFAATSQRKSEA